MPLKRRQFGELRRAQRNRDDIVALFFRQIGIDAITDARNLVWLLHDSFGQEQPGSQFEVGAGRTHGQADPAALTAGLEPDFQRLLGYEAVTARAHLAGVIRPDSGANTACMDHIRRSL